MSALFNSIKNLAASHSREDLKRVQVESEEMRFGPSMSGGSDLASTSMGASGTNNSDFNQWLHAMKMVARLPGGMPPEFRRKLWLALAEQHLQTKDIDWEKEQTKCLCDRWRDDDEELGIQIVKDLHRTGSSLFSGPAGSLNQAKLKRVLLGYARWNPEVGYCQGFNMLGALILQVMDKNDIESLKVMIFLVEGILPPGYFCGSLGGLQADMAVFRELLGGRLPRLAKHLQKLQGPLGESSFEPPLTNVFTMQWFLTLFCTCLPINCVLRVWDLVLIEGSDILLRTALAIWGLLEERILATKTADDFYCKMGTLSGELLNGHLFDSNGLIQKVVDLGPIPELQKMRDKHLYNIAPWRDKRGLRLFFSDDDGDSDEDSKIAVTTAWGLRLGGGGRRGSSGLSSNSTRSTPTPDTKDRMALDISLLKKQYDKLRERQRQAHIILTNTARQSVTTSNTAALPVNQYLLGRNAIVSSKGRRIGPPPGSIPPARKSVTTKLSKSSPKQNMKKGETIYWKDAEAAAIKRKNTITWKEYSGKSDAKDEQQTDDDSLLPRSPSATSSVSSISDTSGHTSSRKRSGSSSYSEDSDGNSSTSTSLCDDDNIDYSSMEASPLRKPIKHTEELIIASSTMTSATTDASSHLEECIDTLKKLSTFNDDSEEHVQTESDDLITIETELIDNSKNIDSENITNLGDTEFLEGCYTLDNKIKLTDYYLADEDSTTECDRFITKDSNSDKSNIDRFTTDGERRCDRNDQDMDTFSTASTSKLTLMPDISIIASSSNTYDLDRTIFYPLAITSTSQLSPIADITKYLSTSTISPLKTPSSYLDYADLTTSTSRGATYDEHNMKTSKSSFDFHVDEEGVTNEYFERINIPERPCRLELQDSLSDNFNSESITVQQRSNYEDSIKGIVHRSPQVVDLNIANLSPITSIIPPCTDITKIPPEKSPLIHKGSLELQATIDTNNHKSNQQKHIDHAIIDQQKTYDQYDQSNTDDLIENIISDRIHFFKEKSFSLDEPQKNREEFRPTSCPEVRSDDATRKSNDRVLKIIEENSMILHRILKKNFSLSEVENTEIKFDFKTQLDAMQEIEKEEFHISLGNAKDLTVNNDLDDQTVRSNYKNDLLNCILSATDHSKSENIDEKTVSSSNTQCYDFGEKVETSGNTQSYDFGEKAEISSKTQRYDFGEKTEISGNTQSYDFGEKVETAGNTQSYDFGEKSHTSGNIPSYDFSEKPMICDKNQSYELVERPKISGNTQSYDFGEKSHTSGNTPSYDFSEKPDICDKNQSYEVVEKPKITGSAQSYNFGEKPHTSGNTPSYDFSEKPEICDKNQSYEFVEKAEIADNTQSYDFDEKPHNSGNTPSYDFSEKPEICDKNPSYEFVKKTEMAGNTQSYDFGEKPHTSGNTPSYDFSEKSEICDKSQNYELVENPKISASTQSYDFGVEPHTSGNTPTFDFGEKSEICDKNQSYDFGEKAEIAGNTQSYDFGEKPHTSGNTPSYVFDEKSEICDKNQSYELVEKSKITDSTKSYEIGNKTETSGNTSGYDFDTKKETFDHTQNYEFSEKITTPRDTNYLKIWDDYHTINTTKNMDEKKSSATENTSEIDDQLELKTNLKNWTLPLTSTEYDASITAKMEEKEEILSKNMSSPKTDSKQNNLGESKTLIEDLSFKNPNVFNFPAKNYVGNSKDTNDISITLSSIKNTIKSIDSLCQDDDSYKKFKRKTICDIPFHFENFEKSDTKNYCQSKNDQRSQLSIKITPSFCIEDNTKLSKTILSPSLDNNSTAYSHSRHSRDYSRAISPRRRRDDEREEYESRVKRDLSPNLMSKSDVLPLKTTLDFKLLDRSISNSIFSSTNNKDNISDSDTISISMNNDQASIELQSEMDQSKLSTIKYPDSLWIGSSDKSLSDKYIYTDKFEIRHTTVTATLYDRFLSQKKERSSKLDKSPSSPIITKAYLDTLKPPTAIDRNSKSAENSPSRSLFETNSKLITTAHSLITTTFSDVDDHHQYSSTSTNKPYYVKSCDNIPSRMITDSNK